MRRTFTADQRAAWQEQKAERTGELMQQLEQGVAAIQGSDEFKQVLRSAAKFHSYSFNNVMLIMCQRPGATRVAGYKTWQLLGRQVRKGEQGIQILQPRPWAVVEQDDHGQAATRQGIAFRTVTVFDIAQTDGEPLPELHIATLTGDADADVYAALVRFAEGEGLTVTNHDPNTNGDDSRSSYKGYYDHRARLIFVKRNPLAQMFKTLIHEIGHHLDPELLQASRPERETVAEATAFVVAAYCSLDTSSYSFPYIATWAGAKDGAVLIKQVMGRVMKIADVLLNGMVAGGDEPPPVGEVSAVAPLAMAA